MVDERPRLLVAVSACTPGEGLAPLADHAYVLRKTVPLIGEVTAPPPLKPAIAGKLIWATPHRGRLAEDSTLKLPSWAGL